MPSQPKKKNTLFLLIGPPIVIPSTLLMFLGLAAVLKKFLACSRALSFRAHAERWRSLVPDLVITVIAAPPAMPCSASKLLVATFTVSIVSAGGMYAVWCGSHKKMLIAPSMRVTLLLRLTPFTLVDKARPGAAWIEF